MRSNFQVFSNEKFPEIWAASRGVNWKLCSPMILWKLRRFDPNFHHVSQIIQQARLIAAKWHNFQPPLPPRELHQKVMSPTPPNNVHENRALLMISLSWRPWWCPTNKSKIVKAPHIDILLLLSSLSLNSTALDAPFRRWFFVLLFLTTIFKRFFCAPSHGDLLTFYAIKSMY